MQMQMNEDFLAQILYTLMIQLGVKIDFIQDNKVVNFSVPSMSDFTAQRRDIAGMEGIPKGEPLAGETLLIMASSFFEENGLKPNGSIRSEYWTRQMGEMATVNLQNEIEKEGICLL